MKERRERILEEFQKVVLFLVEEERRLLQILKKEEDDTLGKLQDSKASLDHQSRSLDLILLQLEEQTQQEPLQMLQDVKDTLTRYCLSLSIEIVVEVGEGRAHGERARGDMSPCSLEEGEPQHAVSRGGPPRGYQDCVQSSRTDRGAQKFPR